MTGSFKRVGTRFCGCPSRGHHAKTANRGNFQFFSISHYPCSPFFILILTCTIILIISILFLFLHFQGLNLLELAAHLEEKAAQLRHEGLGWIKIALARTDTLSLLEILQGHFGHIDYSESAESANDSGKVLTTEENTSEIVEKISTTPPRLFI